jgi:hypothetical protein
VEGVRSVRRAKFQVGSEGFGSQGRRDWFARPPCCEHSQVRRSTFGVLQDRGRENEWVAGRWIARATPYQVVNNCQEQMCSFRCEHLCRSGSTGTVTCV